MFVVAMHVYVNVNVKYCTLNMHSYLYNVRHKGGKHVDWLSKDVQERKRDEGHTGLQHVVRVQLHVGDKRCHGNLFRNY